MAYGASVAETGNPGGILSISNPSEWRDIILTLSLDAGVPEIVAAQFRRAQMLYFLSWLYSDLIKAGEFVAVSTLELVRDLIEYAYRDMIAVGLIRPPRAN